MRIRIQPKLLLGNYKNNINSIKKKNLPTNFHVLFYIGVLQYTKSRITRPKMRNKMLIYLVFNFFLDPFGSESAALRIRHSITIVNDLYYCIVSTSHKDEGETKKYSVK